nr:hypothetical protein [Tanacetum cinerariifolium]
MTYFIPHQSFIVIAIVITCFMLPNIPTSGFKNEQDKHLFNPHVSVQSKKGNSSFITGIHSHFGDDLSKWRIMFVPIMVGAYYMITTEDHFKIMDHTLHYIASPGEIYEPGCIVSWMDPTDNFVAGTKATVLILPKDAFGNNVTSEKALDVSNCVAQTEATSFQLSSRMETFIHQRDKYGNLVPGFHDFDILVVNKGTKLSYPIGDFIMVISDETTKKHILNMPYEFHVFVGYCNGTTSIVNGSGITGSSAGEVTKFSVYLRDTHGLSSPIELERLELQITVLSLSLRVYPQIYPKVSVNGISYIIFA